MQKLSTLLNNITMYRLLLYGLALLLAITLGLSFFDVISPEPLEILLSTTVLLTICSFASALFSKLYSRAANVESATITALILACILPPTTDQTRLLYTALAGFVAIAAKFVISYKGAHIVNPVVAGSVMLSLTGLMSVTWWVGSPYLLPVTSLFGLLILRKVRKFSLFFVFSACAIAMLMLTGMGGEQTITTLLQNAVLSGPLVFFGTVMLTEPATMPSTHRNQLYFAALVGVIYSAQLRFGIFSTSPHMVLALGNIFAFAVTPRATVKLQLSKITKFSDRVFDYSFKPTDRLSFVAGQYAEWTLPVQKSDGRGNRRSFTLASSPTEKHVHLGVKFYEPSSTFKKHLKSMKLGDFMTISQVKGSFTLPSNKKIPLVFIAGGIGVTPFRSMVQSMIDNDEARFTTLYYCVSDKSELAYEDVFTLAKKVGLTYNPVITSPGKPALTPDMLKTSNPALYYISGPEPFVNSVKQQLKNINVPHSRIKTDYFSGY